MRDLIKESRNIFSNVNIFVAHMIPMRPEHRFTVGNVWNFNNMINLACNDKRIGHSHSMVPGHDGKKGYGGTCFPKDTNNLLNLMNKNNVKSYIIENVVKRNEEYDRNEKDWEDNKGRAVV